MRSEFNRDFLFQYGLTKVYNMTQYSYSLFSSISLLQRLCFQCHTAVAGWFDADISFFFFKGESYEPFILIIYGVIWIIDYNFAIAQKYYIYNFLSLLAELD